VRKIVLILMAALVAAFVAAGASGHVGGSLPPRLEKGTLSSVTMTATEVD
jgi:hypothetical protein